LPLAYLFLTRFQLALFVFASSEGHQLAEAGDPASLRQDWGSKMREREIGNERLSSVVRKMPLLRHFLDLCSDVGQIRRTSARASTPPVYDPVRHAAIDDYLDRYLHQNPKYSDTLRINRSEYQVFSEAGEDGMINETFRRIGAPTRFAVEIGASDGLRNCSTFLLVKGWRAAWFETDPTQLSALEKRFGALTRHAQLAIKDATVTPTNVEALLAEASVPHEFDLLVISIDGNDYWVWKGLTTYRPRLILIEYNALYPPDVKWVMKYNPHHRWCGTSYFGASLKSLETLGETKGYRLVGCTFSGIKAFFVREDLVRDRFSYPFTAQNHYEPPRYFLVRDVGHERDFGEFEHDVLEEVNEQAEARVTVRDSRRHTLIRSR
jgi:hypothetical protein